MHLPVKSKTIDEATENDLDASGTGEQEPPREKFYCGICGKYYDKTFEQVHVQMHNGEEKFNCSICNKVFPNEESINMHMNAHQDTRIVSQNCATLLVLLEWYLIFFLNLSYPSGCIDSNQSRDE